WTWVDCTLAEWASQSSLPTGIHVGRGGGGVGTPGAAEEELGPGRGGRARATERACILGRRGAAAGAARGRRGLDRFQFKAGTVTRTGTGQPGETQRLMRFCRRTDLSCQAAPGNPAPLVDCRGNVHVPIVGLLSLADILSRTALGRPNSLLVGLV